MDDKVRQTPGPRAKAGRSRLAGAAQRGGIGGLAVAPFRSCVCAQRKRGLPIKSPWLKPSHRSAKSSCLIALFVASLLLAAPAATRAAAPTAARPNIVFILADDLGWGDVAFHGGNAPTPHLDRLAREGLELGQHYVAPVCSPTRTGLMTGRCWSRFGVVNPQSERALPWDTVTLPRVMKSAGYDTCLTGKWHLGSLPEQGPNHFGFDHSYGSLGGGVTPYSHKYKKGRFTDTWHRNEKLIEETGYVTDLIANEAVRWIESRGAAPFFLYVPFTAVHLPIKEPDEWVARVPAAIKGDVARHYAASAAFSPPSTKRAGVRTRSSFSPATTAAARPRTTIARIRMTNAPAGSSRPATPPGAARRATFTRAGRACRRSSHGPAARSRARWRRPCTSPTGCRRSPRSRATSPGAI
jgi:hypothetical protein